MLLIVYFMHFVDKKFGFLVLFNLFYSCVLTINKKINP